MHAARLVTRFGQGSPEWMAWRAEGLGGSDAAVVMGVNPYPDPTREGLILEKLGIAPPRPDNYAMARGREAEPVVRDQVNRYLGTNFCPACMESVERPWLRASLDGWDPEYDLPCLEIKSNGQANHDAALAGVIPAHHRWQLLHQCLVGGFAGVLYASLGDLRYFEPHRSLALVSYEPDGEDAATYLDAAEAFWAEVRERIERKGAA